MYGVTYIWDGRKFHTITKDKKEWARRRFKQKLLAQGCNWELYSKDDNNEVTRMNALAWVEVMKWVQQRLKSKMYWLDRTKKIEFDKPLKGAELKKMAEKDDEHAKKLFSRRKTDREESNADDVPEGNDGGVVVSDEAESEDATYSLVRQELDDIEFPEPRWFKGAQRDLDEWCKRVNINPELPQDFRAMVFEDMTILCTIVQGRTDFVDMAKERFTPENLYDMTSLYFGKPIEDAAVAVEELTQFFIEVATGENPWFYEFDPEAETEMGDAPPEPEERDEYVTEDDEEVPLITENMDKDKMEKAIALLEEAGLPRARDAMGRFLPGHHIRRPKNIYSAKYPKLACDTCYVAQSCPKFMPGKVCAYHKMFQRFDTRDPNDIADMLFSLTNLNAQRLQRLAIFETLEGGAADPALTGLIQMQIGLLREAYQMHQLLNSARTTVSNGVTKVTVETNHVPTGQSILEKLFSAPPRQIKDEEEEFEDLDKTIAENTPDEVIAPVRKRRRTFDIPPDDESL